MQRAVDAIPERIGNTVLRRVGGDDDVNAGLVDLYAGAYTALDLGDREKRTRFENRLRETAEEEGTVRIAAYRDGALVGVMKWFDFTMRLRNRDVFAAGLGSVAVALDARRRGVGGDLVRAFIEGYRARGATIALLHPFRHDFYRAFGFGHGTKMNRYRIRPDTLPTTGDGALVRQVDASFADAIAACYERVRTKTNGLIVTPPEDFRKQLQDPTMRAFAYAGDGAAIRGFVLACPYVEQPQNAATSELRVYEPIVEGPEAFLGLMAFLRGLGDQFRAIVFETQDDAFYLVPSDPRNGSGRILQPPAYHETNAQGAGVMYRVLDPEEAANAFGNRSARGGAVRLSFTVRDALVAEGKSVVQATLEDGGPPLDVAIECDMSSFSSLVVGAATLHSLYEFGLATISPQAALGRLHRLLAAERPPFCTTRF